MEDEIAWVCYGENIHASHEGFRKSIGADYVPVSQATLGGLTGGIPQNVASTLQWEIPEYDIYIIDKTNVMYAAPFIRSKYPESYIIFLAADPRFCKMKYYEFSKDGPVVKTMRRINRRLNTAIIRYILVEYVDGVIAVSDLFAQKIDLISSELPVCVSHPYIEPSKRSILSTIQPELDTKNVVTICAGRYHKGVDILVRAWSIVCETFPEARLDIVGKGHPDRYNQVDGVNVCGYLTDEKLGEKLSYASLYVHPAILEGFGISVVEAMHAGVPAIVTRETGARSAVERVSTSLITEMSQNDIAETITSYFSSSYKRKKDFSEQSRVISTKFNKDAKTGEFINSFNSLLKRMRY